MDKYNNFILTESTAYVSEIGREKTYYLKQVNRKENGFIFKMIVNTLISIKLF